MNLLVVNPNSTATMTQLIAREAAAVAAPSTRVVARNPAGAPPAIEGPEDGAAAVPHLLSEIGEALEHGDFDAAVVACFDDTGLDELRRQFELPIFGIGECAFHMAMLRAARFCVVTTLPVSVPVIERNIVNYGFAARCAGVVAADVGVLELEQRPDESFEKICQQVERARDQRGCDAIVLGCAGMADITQRLESRYGMPVVDGVRAAVKLAEAVLPSEVAAS